MRAGIIAAVLHETYAKMEGPRELKETEFLIRHCRAPIRNVFMIPNFSVNERKLNSSVR